MVLGERRSDVNLELRSVGRVTASEGGMDSSGL